MMLEKKNLLAAEQQSRKLWHQAPWKAEADNRRLSSLTLGVLGTGSIGLAIARAGKAVGMRTVGFKRDASQPLEGVDVVTSDLPQVLAAADYIVNVLPSTAETRGVLDGGMLQVIECSG
jgi:phosphoglycerate dehydrogenase-like enzyme